MSNMSARSTSFNQSYRCYSVSYIDRSHLENGDKIIMPPSALNRLASMEIEYPMMFELASTTTDHVSHCGVLEFVAEEGVVFMPEWMLKNMKLQNGDIVKVKNVGGIPKGSYIKLQPHTVEFLDVNDPKAVLEISLRRFTCLTRGDTFMLLYNDKEYHIDVVETKPGDAVSVVETDCVVDFAPPLDYKEPEREAPVEEEVVEEEEGFTSFTGTGRRLDGKVVEIPVLSAERKVKVDSKSAGGGGGGVKRKAEGKVVFGGKKSNGKEVAAAAAAKEVAKPETEEEPSFKPFTGKAHSLV